MVQADSVAQGTVAGSYSIGWDVGGWNCDHNSNSRDALVILDAAGHLVGRPWWGNLRTHINAAQDTSAFVSQLFALCQATWPEDQQPPVVLGVDTPLGFSDALLQLAASPRQPTVHPVEASASNPYLFRFTERYLLTRGITPLSAVKDMIGSQATKGLHVVGRFAAQSLACGVWGNGALTVMEVYPSAARRSSAIQKALQSFASQGFGDQTAPKTARQTDQRDALVAALVAHWFAHQPGRLQPPPPETPLNEGWIWVPQDVLP